jgi:methyl-accepting chemotaxis protein-1 (serine sensor receptor)
MAWKLRSLIPFDLPRCAARFMKISTRLLVLVGSLIAAMVCIGLLGLFGIEKSNTSLKSVYEDRTGPAVDLGQIDALTIANRMYIAEALANPTPEVMAVSVRQVQANRSEINRLWSLFSSAAHSPEEQAMAKTFALDRQAFEEEGLAPALAALQANDITEAQSMMVNKMTPLSVALKKDIDALKQHQIAAAATEFKNASERFSVTRAACVLAMLLAALVASAMGLALVRSISAQLGGEPIEANLVAQRVGSGDLAAAIALDGRPPNSLMAALQSMQTSLSDVVRHVRRTSQSVASASAEIAQGNGHLSIRTEQQASALQETAASIEELSQAVHANSLRADQANTLAQTTSRVAVRCGEAVSQVVQAMKGIDASSHQIADIIGVIDGIAFQTNILALNAAVEAARAGEQGRGFAVVASEVRSLAGRSAQAAKEIKTLIGHSVERVEQGNQQVGMAGASMTEVVASIRELADIMGQISAAGNQQSSGVMQVSAAVSLMDQATQQNAAMVEEIAAAASSLRQQADELVKSVKLFKLGNESSLQLGHA